LKIEINEHVLNELEYMTELHRKHGAPNKCESIQDLVDYILMAIADGSRRPGAWERELLERMGLIADCDEHQEYRSAYGKPE